MVLEQKSATERRLCLQLVRFKLELYELYPLMETSC